MLVCCKQTRCNWHTDSVKASLTCEDKIYIFYWMLCVYDSSLKQTCEQV
jgi:hypothetical protein